MISLSRITQEQYSVNKPPTDMVHKETRIAKAIMSIAQATHDLTCVNHIYTVLCNLFNAYSFRENSPVVSPAIRVMAQAYWSG